MVFIPSTCSRVTSRLTSRTTSRVWCDVIWCIRHLRADSVVWLSHTSSIWPWSGTPKVRLYNTFLGGLRQSYQAQHCPADVASADNQTGLPIGLVLVHSHHGLALGVFRVTSPTPPQVAFWRNQKEFLPLMIGMQQYTVSSLVVLGRLARGRTKLANVPSEGSCKLGSLLAFLSWKQSALGLLMFFFSLCRR